MVRSSSDGAAIQALVTARLSHKPPTASLNPF
jgi:hypothetical protein